MATATALDKEVRHARPMGATRQYLVIDRGGKGISWIMERNLEMAIRRGDTWPTKKKLVQMAEDVPELAAGIQAILQVIDLPSYEEADAIEADAVYKCGVCGFEAKSNFGLKSHSRAKHGTS
jgi:hypothetical protein